MRAEEKGKRKKERKNSTSLSPGDPFDPPSKNLPRQLALLAGASYGGIKLRVSVRAAQREQTALCAEADSERGVGPGNSSAAGGATGGSAMQRARRRAAPKVAVDAVVARRLVKIMKL